MSYLLSTLKSGRAFIITNHLSKKIIIILLTIILVLIPETIQANSENNKKESLVIEQNHMDNFDQNMEFFLKFGYIPGLSACIIKNNEIIWSKGYGYSNIENNTKADENTLYLSGSMSKSITATAIFQLYEKGFFKLDNNINDYLPFNVTNPYHPDNLITIRMVLTHTSSLQIEPRSFYRLYYEEESPKLSYWLEDYFYTNGTIKQNVWTEYIPGEKFIYSNLGYCILGYLIECITNISFEQYCNDYIFEPLNMDNTSILLSEINRDKLACPYILGYKYPKLLDPGLFVKIPHYSIIFYPAASMRTSIIDMSHFLIAFMNNGVYNNTQILKKETIEMMQTIQYEKQQLPLRKNYDYGFGWQIWSTFGKEVYIGHGGGMFGYNSLMKTRSSDNTTIIYYLNRYVSNDKRGRLSLVLIENSLFNKARLI